MSEALVVSGMGAVSCFGYGTSALWGGIAEGRHGMAAIERFSTTGLGVKHAALVPGELHANDFERCVAYAVFAGREAMGQAGLHALPGTRRVALVLGTSPGDDTELVHRVTEDVAMALGITGPALTVSTACSSSTNALGLGLELLRAGDADSVVAGGSDVLTSLLFSGFHALGVLSTGECAPFAHPFGTVLGEGAGFLVLERESSARARSAAVLARLLGYGLSCDAFHETSPDPTGGGVSRALAAAIADAGLVPAQVDYVNAHGTGTSANDPAEWRAIARVLGARATEIPVSSTKSALGHAQAAAGVLELITTLLAMQRGCVPQTLHHENPRPNSPPDTVAQRTPRPAEYDCALSTNSAFAGANAAVAVAAPHFEGATRELVSQRVWVRGVSAFGPFGDAAALSRLDGAAPFDAGAGPGCDLEQSLREVDAKGLDRSSSMLLALAQAASLDAELGRARGDARDRSGIVLGVTRVSPGSVRELKQSIELRGLPLLSATAFSRMVLNAPAGTCAKLCGLRGPMSTVSAGPEGGLVALLYAARLVRAGHADLMLGAGVDENPAASSTAHDDAGASALFGKCTTDERAGVRLRAEAIGAPHQVEETVARALAVAGVEPGSIELVVGDGHARACTSARFLYVAASGDTGSTAASALAFVLGAIFVRERRANRALVVSARGGSATAAAVLSWEAA
jgi:3-oxoacyl-[acyl-carrier-protein] synthase II